MNSRRLRAVPAALLALAFVVSPPLLRAEAPPRITDDMVAAGFLEGHPDLRWRREAIIQQDAGRPEIAFEQFKRAARHADKPSAAMVAEMYWEGIGVAQDRALAYVWMDLAAERMWRPFLAKREAYWAALDPAEQARALEEGKAVYAEYGDDVAKPRKEAALERARKRITGSRVGFVGSLTIEIPGPAGNIRIRGDEFYNPTYWRSDRYWAWQDELWRDARPGIVDVGPVSDAGSAPPSSGEAEGGEGRPR